jgi:cytosine/adenosine deaminase-related metal-dependent hydrolase
MADVVLKNLDAAFLSRKHEERHVDIHVSGNRIAAVGPNLTVPEKARTVDCRGKVALPGLINTHHHFFQILTRCLPEGQNEKLFEWLLYHYGVWKYVDAEMVDAATRLALAELLLTGCTTTSDHLYLFPPHVTEDLIGIQVMAARDLGIRYGGTRGSMTMGQSHGGLTPDDLIEDDDKVLASCEAVIQRWHDPDPFSMRQVHLAPCTPFNVTQRLLRETAVLARKYGVRLHTHLAETDDETKYCLREFHKRPLEFMEELGWTGPDVWFAHGIHFNDAELDKLSASGCSVAHCPSSNMRLGSGAARVPEMIKRGVGVGLAVDGSASNDSSDMLGELRQAMLLGRLAWGHDALTARQVISMATEGSARLLGRTEIGVLEIGKAADIALFDIDTLAYAGAADPIAALLFCGYNHTAWMVMVNGEIVVEKGRLVRGNEEQIKKFAVTQSRRLWQRAGVI